MQSSSLNHSGFSQDFKDSLSFSEVWQENTVPYLCGNYEGTCSHIDFRSFQARALFYVAEKKAVRRVQGWCDD